MLRDPERQVMEKAYARWAPVYDALCGPFFLSGRRAAAQAARAVGGRILEIGVGTADASFDCVVGQFVITLVENPERVLGECARVVKPGGQIILVNHLYSERGLAAALERLLAQKARRVGLRPEFPFQRLAAWAQSHGGAELIDRQKVKPFFTLVRFRRAEGQSAAA